MKYTKEERLVIGRRIYEGELTRSQAAEKYSISDQSARNYMRQYRDAHKLPPKRAAPSTPVTQAQSVSDASLEELKAMSKEELIDALVMARIKEARLKKGYAVKGVGAEKEYIPIKSKSIK